MGRQASAGPVTTQLRSAVKVRRQPDPPAFIDTTGEATVSRPRWAAPGLHELAAACLVAVAVAGAAAFTEPFQWRTSHIADAYTLDYVPPGESGDPGRLEIRARAGSSPMPSGVTLYRDQAPISAPIVLDGSRPVSVPMAAGGVATYQVRATLADGALALSNPVWAPSAVIVIDAQPWARVTIASADRSVPEVLQATPVAARLPEGRYTLTFENGGLTAPLTETIDVTNGGQRTFRFNMPGFKVENVLKGLSYGSRKSAKS